MPRKPSKRETTEHKSTPSKVNARWTKRIAVTEEEYELIHDLRVLDADRGESPIPTSVLMFNAVDEDTPRLVEEAMKQILDLDEERELDDEVFVVIARIPQKTEERHGMRQWLLHLVETNYGNAEGRPTFAEIHTAQIVH